MEMTLPDIRKLGSDGSGMVCEFYLLSKTHGLKVYNSERNRDKCFSYQTIGHSVGIGPDCFNPTELYGRFAYVTELVKPAGEIAAELLGWKFTTQSDIKRNGLTVAMWDAFYSENPLLEPIREMKNKLHKKLVDMVAFLDKNDADHLSLINFLPNDMHHWNWGVRGNEPMVLDFSLGPM